MPNLAGPGSSKTLKIFRGALVETACRGEACVLRVFHSIRSANGEVVKIFLWDGM